MHEASEASIFMDGEQINTNKDNKDNKDWWKPAIKLFSVLTGWIVVPVIIALFLGKYLDKRYGTEPWIFVALIIIAFLTSMLKIAMTAKQYMKDLAKEEEDTKNNLKNNGDK